MNRRYVTSKSVSQPHVIIIGEDDQWIERLISEAANHGIVIFRAINCAAALLLQRSFRVGLVLLPVELGTALPLRPLYFTECFQIALVSPHSCMAVGLTALHDWAHGLIDKTTSCSEIILQIKSWLLRIDMTQQKNIEIVQFTKLLQRFPSLPSREMWHELLVQEACRRCNGNISAAARMLGISRQALHQRLQELRQSNLTAAAATCE